MTKKLTYLDCLHFGLFWSTLRNFYYKSKTSIKASAKRRNRIYCRVSTSHWEEVPQSDSKSTHIQDCRGNRVYFMSDSKSTKSYIQCWGKQVYFSRPIVRILIWQACWGKPSILFTLALPRVGFPIWGFPPPGFRVANFAWHYPLSKPNLLGCSKLKPYLSMLKRGQQEPTERLMSGYCCTFIVFSTLSSSTTLPLQSVPHRHHICNFTTLLSFHNSGVLFQLIFLS